MCSYKPLRQSTKVLQIVLFVLTLHMTSHNINHRPYLPQATPIVSNLSLPNIASSLERLNVDGHFNFMNTHQVANDFGNIYNFFPATVLFPKTVADISTTIKHVYNMGLYSDLTVTARGHGHSLHGQSQNHGGIVISMESLKEHKVHVHTGKLPCVDVSGGELWINVLHETLKQGLAPRSWTDYLFYAVLGGLGQFGIITRARISLEPAPKMVKWIRVLYTDFYSFTRDQEQLISSNDSFDYIEGFVLINRTGLVSNWRSTFSPRDPHLASQFSSEGKILYCLEMAMYFNRNFRFIHGCALREGDE